MSRRPVCAKAATYLGSRLASLASFPRVAVWDTDAYEWEHLEARVHATILELRAWQGHCASDPQQQSLLLKHVEETLQSKGPHTFSATVVIDTFLQVWNVGSPAQVLGQFWAALDSSVELR